MSFIRSLFCRASAIRLMTFALILSAAMAGQAQARIFVGLGVPLFFPPFVAPPPAYYPPPYYGPPTVYAPPDNSFSYVPPSAQPLAPPRGYAPGGYGPSRGYAAQSCLAGPYVCPLVQDTPPGGRCSCPANDGRRIRGQAD
jgi:hypothetical protein